MAKSLPRHSLRHRGYHRHLGFQRRMLKGDFVGMQADRGIRVGTRVAVFQVTFDWAADVRQLATNLMMSAGKQFYFKKIVIVGFSDHTIS